MSSNTTMNFIARNVFLWAGALLIASCVTPNKPGSDVSIESLRNFELKFIDEFAVPKKHFNAAFNAKKSEGNAMFEQAIANEKIAARRPVLADLKAQFDADAAHLQRSRGNVSPAMANEMKKDINKIYDHALGR